jgi:hypothetical protein
MFWDVYRGKHGKNLGTSKSISRTKWCGAFGDLCTYGTPPWTFWLWAIYLVPSTWTIYHTCKIVYCHLTLFVSCFLFLSSLIEVELIIIELGSLYWFFGLRMGKYGRRGYKIFDKKVKVIMWILCLNITFTIPTMFYFEENVIYPSKTTCHQKSFQLHMHWRKHHPSHLPHLLIYRSNIFTRDFWITKCHSLWL